MSPRCEEIIAVASKDLVEAHGPEDTSARVHDGFADGYFGIEVSLAKNMVPV